MTMRLLTIALALALAGAWPASAQPQRDPAAAREPGPPPERIRDALERRLEAIRENEAAVVALLDRLDAGEAPAAVARDAREAMRDAAPPNDRRPGDGEASMNELFGLLAEVDAPMRERIRRLAQDDPDRARVILRRAAPELRELARLKRDDPEAFRLRLAMMQAGRDAWRAAARLHRAERDGAGDDELARRREEVAAAVRRRVEMEQRLKARELERLDERVQRLRTTLAEQSGGVDAIVEEQTEQLLERASRPRDGQRP